MQRVVAFLIAALAFVLSSVPAMAADALTSHRVTLKDGRSFDLQAPASLRITPLAEGFKRPRFFTRSPDGRIFLTDMHDLGDNTRGAVYILDGFDAANGKVGKITAWATGLRNPNSVAFLKDAQGVQWIYVALTDSLLRYRYTPGESHPTGSAQLVARFPDRGMSAANGGWHLTRTVVPSGNGKLYVAIGSSCNACVETEALRAVVVEMNPDGSGQRIIAHGLRNAVWMAIVDGQLLATNQGVDHLGPNMPNESFYAIKPGDYGWPSCYVAGKAIKADPKYPRKEGCANVQRPLAIFPAHGSALGFDVFAKGDNAQLADEIVVALHGSGSIRLGHGYKLVRMRRDGSGQRDLVSGFLRAGKVMGRPCGVLRVGPDALLFSDDRSGVIYYVRP
ncbi:MAG: glucose/sorbosone dehydrogenase [Proteobacteria bacterium]|nr:glucose/sorbosone dehydrogenase [Pseudomonadota bacterium]